MSSAEVTKKRKKRVLEETLEVTKKKLLSERKAPNTNKATDTYISALCEYLAFKNYAPLDLTKDDALPDILENFYSEVRTPKGEIYCVQSYKCIRSALNRHFQDSRKINIITDTHFIGANAMFDAMKVQSKERG